MKRIRLISASLAACLLSGCAGLSGRALPTPLPPEYLPTAIALTVEANNKRPAVASPATSQEIAHPSEDIPATSLPLPTDTPAPTGTPPGPTATPFPITLPPPPTDTPVPEVPEAAIQIYRPGDLSKVTPPLHVSAYLNRGYTGFVRVELHGEDGRLLMRQEKSFESTPFSWANLTLDLDFEISAVAEVGRLVISVDDDKGRTKALNSVDLILMSVGEADINPSSALLESIAIQQPRSKALIQGGTLKVSGMARTSAGGTLVAELRSEEDKVVGMRVIGVSTPLENGYGTFSADVPYKVEALTPVRLVIYEGGGQVSTAVGENLSAMTHLSSVEIMLSP